MGIECYIVGTECYLMGSDFRGPSLGFRVLSGLLSGLSECFSATL